MKVLILRFSSLGDILLATPVLDAVKASCPGAEIDWVVSKKFEETLNTNPLISKLMVFRDRKGLSKIKSEIRRTKYDLIFDLHKNPGTRYLTRYLSGVHTYDKRVLDRFMLVHFKRRYKKILPVTKMYFAALNKAGIETPREWKLKFGMVKETELETVRRYGLHNKNYIVLAPGASYFTKMWPREYFRQLSEMITDPKGLNRKVFIIGKGPEEEETGKFISGLDPVLCTDLTGRLTLQETAAVIKFADLVVTNDNGPMHLAECFEKKIVAIFGSTTEEFGFFPYTTKYRVAENGPLDCRPCTHFGRKKCPKKHFKCMNDVLPGMVYEKIISLIND